MKTRASARIAAQEDSGAANGKRKAQPEDEVAPEVPATPAKKKRATKKAKDSDKEVTIDATATVTVVVDTTAPVAPADSESSTTPADKEDDAALVPAVLSFSFDDAKKHLISVDHRFEDLFEKMECKPYQHLEVVHPFRALATSILGQQISWLAARSIIHRFRRLYDDSLPEKHSDDHRASVLSFPTPEQVAKTDITTLKSAGLSTRKAEYVQDLAARFADGRLSTQKLLKADDDELAEMLIQVRGIGRWTVDMFSIFSLRRPNILPVGDLGVQKGMARWFLSLHSPNYTVGISPQKLPGDGKSTPATEKKKTKSAKSPEKNESPTKEGTPDLSSVPPTTVLEEDAEQGEAPKLPPPFTPSIKKTLGKAAVDPDQEPEPLPEGLTIAVLKSRLDGKKKIKGAILTPKEMEDLSESWKPYRSLGVYYMWSLADTSTSD